MSNGSAVANKPDLETSLAAANAAIVGDMPVIKTPPPGFVKLPRGLFRNNEWRKDAVVRELTGEDEEIFSRIDPFEEPLKYVDAVLGRAVESIGGAPVTEMDLQELLLGERDTLYLAARIATYGDELDFNGECESCKVKNDLKVSLTEDIPVQPGIDPEKLLHEVTLSKGVVVHVMLATGGDQTAAFAGAGAVNSSERNTVLLARCIRKVDGDDILNKLQYAKKLGLKDRSTLLNYLNKAQCGPIPGEVKTSCAACASEISIYLTWANLLRF